jgi:hypothetical protein
LTWRGKDWTKCTDDDDDSNPPTITNKPHDSSVVRHDNDDDDAKMEISPFCDRCNIIEKVSEISG